MGSKIISTILNLKDNFSSKLLVVNKNIQKMNKEQKEATREVKVMVSNFKNGFEEMENKVKSFAKIGIATAVAGSVAVVKSSLDTFKEFEQAMAQTAATAGITQNSEAYKQLEQAARLAGSSTSKTAQEAAEALGYMSLAGWSVKESTEGLMPILRLSEATQADLATTSDLVTDSMSALGVKVSDMQSYLDKLAVANSKSNQTAQQLMEAYINVGGTFKNLGTPIEESAALLGVLANRGLKGSEAGNSLSSTLINLKKKSGESYEALKALNLSAFDNEGNFKGVTSVLMELNEKTKNLTQEQRDMYFTMIGGKTNIATLNSLMDGLNTVTDEGISELEKLTRQISNSSGALDDMAHTVNNTTSGAFKRLSSAVDDFKIMIGSKISPYLKDFIDKLANKIPNATLKISDFIDTKLIPSISIAVQKAKEIFSILAKHKETILNVVTVLSSLYVSYKTVKGTMTAFAGVIKVVRVAWALLSGTMLISPITWIIVGLAALIAGFVMLYRKSEAFRNAVSKLWESLKIFAKSLSGSLIPKLKGIGDGFKNVGKDIGSYLLNKLSELKQWFYEKISPSLQGLVEKFKVFAEAIKPVIEFFLNPFLEKLKFIKDFIGLIDFKTVADTIIDGIKILVESLIKVFGGILDFLTGVFTADWTKAWQGIKDIFAGIFEGVIGVLLTGLNGAIKLINSALQSLGSLKLPDWDLLPDSLQGKSFSFPVIPEVQVPNFELGTHYFKGGLAEINERGGEIVNLPNGSQVIPTDKSEKILNDSNKYSKETMSNPNNKEVYQNNNDLHITLNIQGNVIGNEKYVNELGEVICRKVKLALSNI